MKYLLKILFEKIIFALKTKKVNYLKLIILFYIINN